MAGAFIYTYMFYVAFGIFVIGTLYRVVRWANIPVPVKITLTGRGYLDNPQSKLAAALRVAAEVLLFRSLFRNTKYNLETHKISSNRILWLGAMVFHFSLLLIVLRHIRFFFEPVPSWVVSLRTLEAVGPLMPGLSLSSILIIIALLYLLLRRILNPELLYISIAGDYIVLVLLLSIALSGIAMAYFHLVDIVAVKHYALSLVALSPVTPNFPGLFYLHFSLVSILLIYFPFSKLMHAPGVFFSPTRNQVNDPRRKRHVNPWNYPVKAESYKKYHERYKDALDEVEE